MLAPHRERSRGVSAGLDRGRLHFRLQRISGSSSTASGGSGTSGGTAATGGFGSGSATAQGYYDVAEKAVKTAAPDAVFLIVQTPSIATQTPSPSWAYLFGSKKANKVYAVTVTDGKADKAVDMGATSITAAQWAKIPPKDKWKIDSNVAFDKASATYTARIGTAPPSNYAMGMATFVPAATSGIKPFVWSVNFDPAAGGADAKSRQIDIDATTGAVLPQVK